MTKWLFGEVQKYGHHELVCCRINQIALVCELEAKDAAMRDSLSNLSSGAHVRVKNAGTLASKAAVATCTKTVNTLMSDGNKQRNSNQFSVNISSLPPNGQSHKAQRFSGRGRTFLSIARSTQRMFPAKPIKRTISFRGSEALR